MQLMEYTRNATEFIPHANVPGPARLEVERADNSGTVNADPMFMADRLAITNLVMAYSYLIDEGRWDDWFALFSDDIAFETTTPELGTILVNGKKAFKDMVDTQYIAGGRTSKAVRRHTQANVHVAEQTGTTAKVRTYMLISTVPAADQLHTLTTGTYNANLEKRNGRWIITRWYMECDAPLAPSRLPEGLPEDEFQWIPDPSVALPDVGPIAVPLKGQVTLKNHPFSMGALYEGTPVWTWNNIDVVLVDHLTEARSAAAFLPEQCTTLPIPELPGYAAIKQVWAHYRDSSFGPYSEFIVMIPCLFKRAQFLHVPFIYVDTDRAMASGREVGGWPKKLADIRMDRIGNEFRCSIDRNRERIASVGMRVGGKLFSTPLPADKPIALPYPYSMTLPIPRPTGKTQEDIPFPTTTLKVIPGVGTDIPEVARLIGAPWRMKGDFHSGSAESATYGQSDDDPIYKLPILKMLGTMFFTGRMTLALKEMVVLDDMLKTDSAR
jgi:acetoacetate decarboxylase/3-phenylpropionate/cinnamic acid dioxygenase small subunit